MIPGHEVDLTCAAPVIRMLRERRGLLQEDLARKIGVTVNRIQAAETGYVNPNLYLLIQIAEFFHVDLEELTDEKIEGIAE